MSNTNLQNYIIPFAQQWQDLEDALQDFYNCRDIDGVTGVLLDIAGEMVGESRNGRSDEDYRAAIKLKIILNVSNGEPETLVQSLRIFVNATSITYVEKWPAKVGLTFASTVLPLAGLREKIEQIAPAGVKIDLGWVSEAPFFGFDGEGGLPADPDTLGFGEDNDATEGGFLVEEIS